MSAYVVFNLGGTGMRVAIFVDGKLVAIAVLKTDGHNYAACLQQLIKTATELMASTKGVTFAAVGVALAAEWDESGIITGSGNLPGWHGHNLRRDFEVAFGLPVVVLGDCEAEAFGEGATYGQPCIYIGFGTGVGCGVYQGPLATSKAELGHLMFDRSSKLLCGCGAFGHVEALLGGANLPGRFEVLSWEHLTETHWKAIVVDMGIFLREIPALGKPYQGLPIVVGGSVGLAVMNDPMRHELLIFTLQDAKCTVPAPQLRPAQLAEPALVGAGYAAMGLAKL